MYLLLSYYTLSYHVKLLYVIVIVNVGGLHMLIQKGRGSVLCVEDRIKCFVLYVGELTHQHTAVGMQIQNFIRR